MRSRLVPRAFVLAVCAAPLAASADDAADAALHNTLTKALAVTIQRDVATQVASPSANLPRNTPVASKSDRVQPTREPPADVAVLEVRPDSVTCLANPSQDDGC